MYGDDVYDDGQVLKRNRETHARTMWTTGKDSAIKSRTSTTAMASTNMCLDDAVATYKDQLNQLREENAALKEALEEVRV